MRRKLHGNRFFCFEGSGGNHSPGQGGSRGAVATLPPEAPLFQRVGIDFDRVLDGHAVAVVGEHVGKLHHTGRATGGDHFRTAGDDVVALALTDFGTDRSGKA